ncbi:maleylpyruvate isomerase family mycothiol-dependent enzyme [Kribbella sp. NPDC023855]|uniref:maleylpyruvate isomerase family mycothiol-dependent enzyme n=1 Tax=Kribbella sp. NPDC023855 TaxID=3154698 RepID=UPI0033D6E29E
MKPDMEATVARLTAVLAGLDDEAARAPSGLPGWSRGHVLTHVANFSEAMTRQVEEALAGRLVEMYDGGRPARDAAIEAGAGRSADELREHVRSATTGLLAAWRKVDDWSRPVTHRNGDLAATVYTGWRELEVHTVDLALEPTSDDWSVEFCLHLLDFLKARTPDGLHLILVGGNTRWENGTGEDRVLTGTFTDLTAWMAGRRPVRPITGDLPELKPWP